MSDDIKRAAFADAAADAYKRLMAATNKYNQFAAITQQAADELQQAQRETGVALEAWLTERGDLRAATTLPPPAGQPVIVTDLLDSHEG